MFGNQKRAHFDFKKMCAALVYGPERVKERHPKFTVGRRGFKGPTRRTSMRAYPLAVVMLLVVTGVASAQTAGGTRGPAGSSLGAIPGQGSLFNSSSRCFASGSSFSSPASVAGVPNTSTPGIIGTDATPSGVLGDEPEHPGFPAPLNTTH